MEDFNYGTLLRLDCSKGYTEENTIFGESQNLLIRLFLTPNPTRTPCRALRGGNRVGRGEAAPPRPAPSPPRPAPSPFFFFSLFPATRIQFFAIEIARNREGCNNAVYNSAKEPARA